MFYVAGFIRGIIQKELGISAEIVKVTDIQDIINYGVMMMPALVIDGEVKSADSVPSPEEIIKLLKE